MKDCIDIEHSDLTYPTTCVHKVVGSCTVSESANKESLYNSVAEAFDTHAEPNAKKVEIWENYTPSFIEGEQTFPTTLTKSNYYVGQFSGDAFEPMPKYTLTLRDKEEGEMAEKSPSVSLSLSIEPQRSDLLTRSGNTVSPPYGNGTRVVITSAYLNEPSDLLDRAEEILRETLDVTLDRGSINQVSKRIQYLEQYHRFDNSLLELQRETAEEIRSLIPHTEKNSDRLEVHFESQHWHLLGLPQVNQTVRLKLYQSKKGYSAPGAIAHPKLETILTSGEERCPHFDEWENLTTSLHGITSSMCQWAGVQANDLVADDFYAGANGQHQTWAHPVNGRVARESAIGLLEPELRRRIYANQTAFDVLHAIAATKVYPATYKKLTNRTGLSKRTVRKYVAEFERMGILHRFRTSLMLIEFSSEKMERMVEELLVDAFPEDTAEFQKRRASDRQSQREALSD
ncbi:hypothetical protein ACLI4Q_10890 [Natrialbaceae archaeon A-CW1-1]